MNDAEHQNDESGNFLHKKKRGKGKKQLEINQFLEEQVNKMLKVKPVGSTLLCNCAKTKCLKMYCDCFAAGFFCDDSCNCYSCCNRVTNKVEIVNARIKAIKRVDKKKKYEY